VTIYSHVTLGDCSSQLCRFALLLFPGLISDYFVLLSAHRTPHWSLYDLKYEAADKQNKGL
jgi:hypothetical protein